MSLALRILVYVPIAWLIMVAYVAPQSTDAGEVVRIASRKTVKVLFWTAVLIVAMFALEFVVLP